MKRIICGVAASLMLGCSTPPTALSPTALAGPSATSLRRPNALQTVTLVFYGQSDDTRMVPVVDLPVTLVAYPSGEVFNANTGKEGSVAFSIAGDDGSVWMSTPTWEGYCATGHYMTLLKDGEVGASMSHELARCSR
jgi:hypothetical protein